MYITYMYIIGIHNFYVIINIYINSCRLTVERDTLLYVYIYHYVVRKMVKGSGGEGVDGSGGLRSTRRSREI